MNKPQTIGKYTLIGELGRGGFATVYRARDKQLNREVAVKVIDGRLAQESAFVSRFRQEARTAASLHHPNIVTVYDFGEEGGQLFLTMRLVQGQTLQQYLDQRHRLTIEQALPLLRQLAGVLDYLGRQGLIHRDIKPSNILLEGQGEQPTLVLTDFGLARSLEASLALTRTQDILGTPTYISPEQVDSGRWGKVSPLTDIYALGVLTYQMLVGRPPFVGDYPMILVAHAQKQPPPPQEFFPEIEDEIAEVLLRGLTKQPEQRYPTAAKFIDDLQQAHERKLAEETEEASLLQLEEVAQEKLATGDWLETITYATQMLQLDPDWPSALTLLTQANQGLAAERAAAQERRELKARYQKGLGHLDANEWQAGIAILEEVIGREPPFLAEVEERLEEARREEKRARWYEEALVAHENGRWETACSLWSQLLQEAPHYQDGQIVSLLSEATQALLQQYQRLKKQLAILDRRSLIKADRLHQLEEEATQNEQLRHKVNQVVEALAIYELLAQAAAIQDWPQVIRESEKLTWHLPDYQPARAWIQHAQEALQKQPNLDHNSLVWTQDKKEMLLIPAGTLHYGDQQELITLEQFWMDKTPVTTAEFGRFVEQTGYQTTAEHNGWSQVYRDSQWQRVYGANWHHPGGPGTEAQNDHPVVQVSWDDAQAYARWAGKRLPNERQWEWAARGEDGRKYPWGNYWEANRCNTKEARRDGTTSVGYFSPAGDSPFGISDLSGNVWEWTITEEIGLRMIRGGSWINDQWTARTTVREWLGPVGARNDLGFRLICRTEDIG